MVSSSNQNQTNTKRYRRSLLGLTFLSVLALTGFGCLPRGDTSTPIDSNVTLIVWGLWQDTGDMASAITSFQEATNVDVEYKKIASVADYEKELLSALAEGRGPDVFVIHHSWLPTKRSLLAPAPTEIIDERALREEFVDVVAQDLLHEGQVYGLPVSVDTLALYYNKDILSAAGVARPPQNWDEFQQVVERITRVNRFGIIERSAAAIGTAANVSRAADILQLLILQSGIPIADPNNFSVGINNDEGQRSLTFYTDFANKSKKVYTWDLQQDYSIDAFAEGETAMMINYSYQAEIIRAKNPRLSFDVGPAPQITDGQVVNFAAYWPFAVSRQSTATNAAWQFLRHLTSAEQAGLLNRLQDTPPARRDGVIEFQRDPSLGVFADQALTAASWTRGDIVAVDAIVNAMIDNAVTGGATAGESLRRGQDQLNQIQPEPPQPETEQPAGQQPGINIGIF